MAALLGRWVHKLWTIGAHKLGNVVGRKVGQGESRGAHKVEGGKQRRVERNVVAQMKGRNVANMEAQMKGRNVANMEGRKGGAPLDGHVW